MAKVTVNSIGSGTGTGPAIDANFTAVAAAIEKQLSRDGTSPNTMEAELDMNSNRLVNIGNGINPQDGVSKVQVENLISAAGSGLIVVQRDDSYTGDGSTVTYNVSVKVGTYSPGTNNLVVAVDGIVQKKGAAYNEDSAGTNITFTTAPPNGSIITLIKNTATTNSVSTAAGNSFDTPTGGLTRNVQDKLADVYIDVADFCVMDGVTDDTAGLQAAFTAAAALSSVHVTTADGGTGGSFSATINVPVISPGGKIKISSAITVQAGRGIPFISRGKTIITGDGTHKGIVYDACVDGHVEGFIFKEFTTAVELDTNNTSLSYWYFKNVEFINCTTGIDTKSYADSRSTILVVDGIRGGGTDTYIKSYCDVTWINAAFVWNKGGTASFVIDSSCFFTNSLLVPKNATANSRWIDFGPTVDPIRSLVCDNVRFSGENAGITCVYNYVDGSASSRDTNGIKFNNCYMASGAGGPSNAGSAVVLMSNGSGASHAPNHITFRACSVNGPTTNVGIKTESAEAPIASSPVGFHIHADEQTIQSATGNFGSGFTFVESGVLETYYGVSTHKIFTDRKQTSTATGSITLDLLDGSFVRLANGGATTITGFTNAYDSDIIILYNTSAGTNVTVQDQSVSGNIYLQGAANFNLTANDTLMLGYEAGSNRWMEISRSAN